MKTDRLFLSFSILGIAIATLFGAFGAHSLKDLFSTYEMDVWNKGIFYQISNSLGLMILVALRKIELIKKNDLPFYFLIIGIVFFFFLIIHNFFNKCFSSPTTLAKNNNDSYYSYRWKFDNYWMDFSLSSC
jgi:uncharacterized membrane protein YgdD (TMEM256/DUF423 family)